MGWKEWEGRRILEKRWTEIVSIPGEQPAVLLKFIWILKADTASLQTVFTILKDSNKV